MEGTWHVIHAMQLEERKGRCVPKCMVTVAGHLVPVPCSRTEKAEDPENKERRQFERHRLESEDFSSLVRLLPTY
ncbi:hypothetical protein NDU88_002403 [Pleurodeles waltl]|uniref:Uncharacterized protein n=1 Tax=Pleurodeles waltl TaxID=8319 RepID=A0AAV7MQF2_PLEWA|nr:hypothetical protein NDU88_002403 [Pleurodeles waltl]